MEQLFEMHAHTSETSNCGNMSAKSMVETYIKLGYSGIVVTDHLSTHTYMKHNYDALNWDEKIDIFMRGFNAAKNASKGRINILLGMELRFDIPNCENDYLVYGVTESFLRNNGDLINMNIKSFSSLAHKNGLVIYQAHPFRYDMTITRPKYLDGIEVFNGNPRHNSNNSVAKLWAEINGYKRTAGSDYHEKGDEGKAGILFSEKINTNEDLLRALRNNNYILKTHV